ncbi:MAG: endonuclease III [Candidatus Methanomethylicia archaeon]|nr:endonuclease III [Candidatus Methanomethylicia archaeon]
MPGWREEQAALGPSGIIRKMRESLGDARTALNEISSKEPHDPFRVLIGTILSHRTKDEKTAEAVERLFSEYGDAYSLAAAPVERVAQLIKPVGFYNVKSRRIVEVASIISKDRGGEVPDTLDALMELPSVGRKTANCVLVYAFGKAAIPVDTHVHRIANRLGLVQTDRPEETEHCLETYFPKEMWVDVNDVFVSFGKSVCRPVGPRCGDCLLAGACRYSAGVPSSRKGKRT